ncbi:MAG: hypothetical protein GY760_29355 [Deltaproteobacteria bacterium]|nr:hypothetical protein [Deltaproteobacteria bacterium]
MGKECKNEVKLLDNLTFYSMLSILQGGLWLQNDIEKFLKDYGISHGRFSILISILESSDKSMLPIEMARILGKSKPTISKMIQKLEDDKYLITRVDINDGRTKRLVLTKKANDLLDIVIPLYNKRLAEMSSGLTDRDKSQLMEIMAKINFLDSSKQIVVIK